MRKLSKCRNRKFCFQRLRVFDQTKSNIMLYLVGLGLGDAKDITVRGLEIVKKAEKVYLESYTSILTVGKEALV